MTIREVINVLIDAPDKDKPFIVEVCKDAVIYNKYACVELEIKRIVNCEHLSVAEAEREYKE